MLLIGHSKATNGSPKGVYARLSDSSEKKRIELVQFAFYGELYLDLMTELKEESLDKLLRVLSKLWCDNL